MARDILLTLCFFDFDLFCRIWIRNGVLGKLKKFQAGLAVKIFLKTSENRQGGHYDPTPEPRGLHHFGLGIRIWKFST